jgi:DNA primase
MFHDDKTPSMSLLKFPDGNWRFKCFGCGAAGDPITYVQRTAGMGFIEAVAYLAGTAERAPEGSYRAFEATDSFAGTPAVAEQQEDSRANQGATRMDTAPGQARRLVKAYDYFDKDGVLLYQVQRFEPKDFRQRRPHPDQPGKWVWDMCGVSRVLFRLPALLSAAPGNTCYYVEGEKDVETLEQKGLLATTHCGGAGSFRDELLDSVKHLRVVVIPDNDDPGKQLMRRVFAAARAKHCQVGFRLLPEKFKDVTEFFEQGGTVQELESEVK